MQRRIVGQFSEASSPPIGNTLAVSACHHKPLENTSWKQGMETGKTRNEIKKIQVRAALVFELDTEERIFYNPPERFYRSDLLGLV